VLFAFLGLEGPLLGLLPDFSGFLEVEYFEEGPFSELDDFGLNFDFGAELLFT